MRPALAAGLALVTLLASETGRAQPATSARVGVLASSTEVNFAPSVEVFREALSPRAARPLGPGQKKTLRFFASRTFWSSTIFRRAIRHDPSTRRSRSSRLPTRKSVSVSTRLR